MDRSIETARIVVLKSSTGITAGHVGVRFLSSICLTCLSAIFFFLSETVVAQQNVIRVIFEGDESKSSVIGKFELSGVSYGSLNDFSELLSLNTYANLDTRKFEIKLPGYRMRVAAGNPFVVVTDLDTEKQSIIQMSANVLLAAEMFFVPVEEFLEPFNLLYEGNIIYDRSTETMRVAERVGSNSYDINDLTIEQRRNGYLIRIKATRPFNEYEAWLRQDNWLYVTIANARADTAKLNSAKPTGIVQKILVIQNPTAVQLTFKLNRRAESAQILPDPSSNDLLLTVHTPTDSLIFLRKQQQLQQTLEDQRNRWKLDVIVIDPGHGGKDPGTVGVTRAKEKDITLGIALKLGEMIERNLKGVKVVYTRKRDKFVELYRRGKIANEAGGKLFISIHCNAMPRKPHPLKGFEIYLLRPGRTQDAIAIAERENAVVRLEEGYEKRYQELTEESFILLTMAQSAYARYSEQFAALLQQQMEKRLELQNLGVKQAGFYVLVGASMPNVLVETGYLSNRSEEKFLKSSSGQRKVARGIFHAIKKYKESYEEFLDEGTQGTSP